MARIIFMGSPEIAVPSLQALAKDHEMVAVVTQPDQPKGRGLQQAAPAVKIAAQALGFLVLQPEKIRSEAFIAELQKLQPDFIVVVAYGKILPQQVLQIPQICCINLHFSLLPKYRGAACVAYALLHGDDETGVTSIVMEEGLDSGPILMQWSEAILPEDTTGSLSLRLADLGASQLVQTIAAVESGQLRPVPQDSAAATQAPKISKSEGQVRWDQTQHKIYNRFRAFTPWPGLYSFLEQKRIVWTQVKPSQLTANLPPGTLVASADQKLYVHCLDFQLEILQLKPEGKKQMSAGDFLRGWSDFKPVVLQ